MFKHIQVFMSLLNYHLALIRFHRKLRLFIVYLPIESTIYLKTTDDGSLAASETRLFSEGNPIASKSRLVSLTKCFIFPDNHGLSISCILIYVLI